MDELLDMSHATRHTSRFKSIARHKSQIVLQKSRMRYVSHVTPQGRHESLDCQSHPRTLVQHLIVFVQPSAQMREISHVARYTFHATIIKIIIITIALVRTALKPSTMNDVATALLRH